MKLLRPLALALVGATLTACSSASRDVIPPSHPTTSPSLPAHRVVFSVTECCGFIGPPEPFFEQQAHWTVYGDGTVLTAAPVSEGAAWRVTRSHVSVAQVRRWIAEADRSSVFVGSPDLGRPPVADVGSTVITFRSDAAPARRVDVYALGFDRAGALTPGQLSARRALAGLVHEIGAAAATSTDPYPVDRVSVLRVQWGGSDEGGGRAPAWVGTVPATGRCVTLDGAAATRAYLAALHNPGARWRVGGHTVTLVVRAVVPGGQACAA